MSDGGNDRLFRCGICLHDEGRHMAECVFSWSELLDHLHGKKDYWEVQLP